MEAPTSPNPQPDEVDTRALNWGAFALTPFWLLANGFFFSLAVYLVLAWLSPWLMLPMSVLFLIKGTQWSWGEGQRWKSHAQFADAQAAWAIGGYAAILGALVFGLLKLAGVG